MEEIHLSGSSQSFRSFWDRTAFCFSVLQPYFSGSREAEREGVGMSDQFGPSRDGGRDDLDFWLVRLARPPTDCAIRGWFGGGLAVLCATPVRGHVLGACGQMELHGCGPAWKFFLSTAAYIAVVFREYWIPPYSSFESPHSELQPGAMPPFSPDVSGDPASHDRGKPEDGAVPTLGRSCLKAD